MDKTTQILRIYRQSVMLYPDMKLRDIVDKILEKVHVSDTYIYRLIREQKEEEAELERIAEELNLDEKKRTLKVVDGITGTSEIRKNKDGKRALNVPKGVSFDKFCTTFSYPFFGDNFRWQKVCYGEIGDKKNSLMLVHRDAGKSILLNRISQYYMERGWDVLYLGWTDRRKDIAGMVFDYFFAIRQVITKIDSKYHFEIANRARFDTYSTTDRKILGKHPMGRANIVINEDNQVLEDYIRRSDRKLVIIMDDVIDDKFAEEPHKEKEIERRFTSTIYSINPNKFIFCGTKKFAEDFYWFVQKFFGKDLYTFMRSPYLEEHHIRYDQEPDNPMNLTTPERFTHPDQPEYTEWKELQLLTEEEEDALEPLDNDPEEVRVEKLRKLMLKSKMDIVKKERQMCISDPYWWFSEYMQDPHNIKGEVWDSVGYFMEYGYKRDYDAVVVFIDRATTQKETSDDTGIIVIARHQKTGIQHVVADYTRKISLHKLAVFMEGLHKDLKAEFFRAKIEIWLEQQGGGADYYQYISDFRADFPHYHSTDVHNSQIKKEKRIRTYLGDPIRKKDIVFHESLRLSKVVEQILSYPHCLHDDAIDALALGYWKMNAIKRDIKGRMEGLRTLLDKVTGKGGYRNPLEQPRFKTINRGW